MTEHGISVWLDPDWWEGSGVPRWLAGQNMSAKEGQQYSTFTGAGPAWIEADNVCNGHTPSEAVNEVVRSITEHQS